MSKRRSHGEGTVIQRGKSWSAVLQVGVDEQGRRVREWRSGFATKREATDGLARLRAEVDRGEYLRPTELTVEAHFLDWLAGVRSSLKETTWAAYDGEVRRHIIPRLGHIELAKLSERQLRDFLDHLATNGRLDGKGGLSPKYVRNIATTISTALKSAEDSRLIQRSPARSVRKPRVDRNNRARELAWGREELRLFLDSWRSAPVHYAFFRLAATTGMRRGELLGLRMSDIDFDAGQLSLVRAVAVAGKKFVTSSPKSGRGRCVTLDESTLQALRDAIAANQRNALRTGKPLPRNMFVHVDGRPFTPHYISHCFTDRRRGLALPDGFRLHDVRHLAATMMIQAGTPLKVASDRLGHSSVVVTGDLYVHATPQMQSDAADTLAAMID